MRKLLFFLTALTLSTGLWANEIEYTATEGLGSIEDWAFDLVVQTHSFNSNTGRGSVTFRGDVTAIGEGAFKNHSELISITLPNTITTIGKEAFSGCSNLTSFTVPEGVTTIGADAFAGVGTPEAPVALILPDRWNYADAPSDNRTAWYGGYFNSNLYSTEGATDKQAAITDITAILDGYSTSTYLQSVLAEEVEKINNAANKPTVNETKQAATDKLETTVAIYAEAYSEGQADALGDLGTEQEGTAVKVTKGEKSVMLYAPDKVDYLIIKK